MIDPATIAAALTSAEANVAALQALARKHAGKPTELDARILVGAARRITRNLRQLLATAERRTT
jgi:multidrug resistance efflux pump